MTGSDRPEPIDPADDSWPQEDPDLTRVVPMGTPTGPRASAAPATDPSAAAGSTMAGTTGPGPSVDPAPVAEDTGAAQPAAGDAPSGWSASGSGVSSWNAAQPPAPTAGPAGPPSAPTSSYTAEPPTTVVGPPSGATPAPYSAPAPAGGYGYASPTTVGTAAGTGGPAATDYAGGFGATPSYQQPYGPGTGPTGTGGGPQVIMPPATNVILPPTRIPQAESRVGINAIGTILGILLVFGGLILVLRFGGFRGQDAAGASTMDYLKFTWFVLGALLVALPTFLVTWASWTALVPGLIVTGASVWAMVTPMSSGGAYYIDKATGWAFGDLTLGQFAAAGYGLLVGLPLLLAGFAAVFLRAGVRRTIVRQVQSLQQ